MMNGNDMHPARVNFFHASPDAPPVDVYLNNHPVATNLAYKSFTPYLPLHPGLYAIRVFPAGTMATPLIDQMIEVRPGDLVTLAIVGSLAEIGLLTVGPSAMPLIYGMAFLRFIQLSPNAPPMDVAIQGGPTLFSNVEYKEITNYRTVDPGTYTLAVSPAGTVQAVLLLPGIPLEANLLYTLYTVGLVGGQPPLEAVLALDMG